MNAIVVRHYPVSRLPDDLRELVGDAEYVTIMVELEKPAQTADQPDRSEHSLEHE